MVFWGIDTEGKGEGLENEKTDIHSIQVCSSDNENTGHAFRTSNEFHHWIRGLRGDKRPTIFYAFSLAFEFGSLAAWELLGACNKKGQYPWPNWLDDPKNLFWIQIAQKRIPVYDTRCLFSVLSDDKSQLSSLKRLGSYLSKFYDVDAEKLDHPLGDDFGKRAPTPDEWPAFAKYGIRDAYITALAGRWLEENVMKTWLKGKVPIEEIYSWGTVARKYLELPNVGTIKYRKPDGALGIGYRTGWPNMILDMTTAGRADAFVTGNVGKAFYNDVTSLYPIAAIHTQAMLIKDLQLWNGDKTRLLGPVTWERFYEVTGAPYGWILGDFHTDDDIWGLPVKREDNNWFCTGDFRESLYHTLALEAANADAIRIHQILLPTYATKNDLKYHNSMENYERLTIIKLDKIYKGDVQKHCIKSTINAATGVLGQAEPTIKQWTNPLAYNTLLAESHLIMSQLFHQHQSETHPIFYMDTDSFFWDQPVEKTLGFLEPYPTLPFQVDNPLPLTVGVKGESGPEGCVIFRGKMYYLNHELRAYSAWKPKPEYFNQIVEGHLKECDVERQVSRKWKTKDKTAKPLKIGRWFVKKEHWNFATTKRIFRADPKRCRVTRDSYQLFLNGESQTSRAWTRDEAYTMEIETYDHKRRDE